MDLTTTLLIALGAAALAGCIVLIVARQAGGDNEKLSRAAESLSAAQAELAGRVSQLAESNAASQAQLAKLLEERLADVTTRVGETLQKSSEAAHVTLTDLRTRLAVIDQAQQNITQLSEQVVGLQQVLTNRHARGAFGEIQLQDLVTSALPPSAYDFQVVLGNGKRADCLLRLPNPPGPIAIDAKFPLENYHRLREAQTDADRAAAGRAFAADVQRHVSDIAERYIVPEETAESALMFLPSEAVYAELHANFADTVEKSYRARVWIVSPTTLMATLNTVRAVLKDARMREQAGVIQREVRYLLEDIIRLQERVDKLDRHFDQAGDDIRNIKISADKIVMRGGRIEEVELGEAAEDEAIAEAGAEIRRIEEARR